VDLGVGYKVTCKESDQDHVYIILCNSNNVRFMNIYTEIYQEYDEEDKLSR
jgi:hypothetical protein